MTIVVCLISFLMVRVCPNQVIELLRDRILKTVWVSFPDLLIYLTGDCI
jgi:hypothetical protein